MTSTRRKLRSEAGGSSNVASHDTLSTLSGLSASLPSFSTLSSQPPIRVVVGGSEKLPGLNLEETKLLRLKQRHLALKLSSTIRSLPSGTRFRTALEASLFFAQSEAGGAVCVDAEGWVLTCAHCFGDTQKQQRAEKRKWLLFYTGVAVQVEWRALDSRFDLALARIIAIESNEIRPGHIPPFSFIPLETSRPSNTCSIICIGQPGYDEPLSTLLRDPEYSLVSISHGRLRGMIPGRDPSDNSEIGSLKHDAWTYWGHSGAPLISLNDGTIVGLHSSWDPETAMRHGVPARAIINFLQLQRDAGIGPSLSLPQDGCQQPQMAIREVIVIDDD